MVRTEERNELTLKKKKKKQMRIKKIQQTPSVKIIFLGIIYYKDMKNNNNNKFSTEQ